MAENAEVQNEVLDEQLAAALEEPFVEMKAPEVPGLNLQKIRTAVCMEEVNHGRQILGAANTRFWTAV